jgi:CBS domain-containing protein
MPPSPAMISTSDRMSRLPRAIDCHASIAEAREAMAALGVHHLPVTDRGALVGMVAARDLDRLQVAKPLVAAEVLPVFEAMTPDPLVVAPGEALAPVVERMAALGVDSAVVVEGDAVAGIFTTHDALRLLVELLDGEARHG